MVPARPDGPSGRETNIGAPADVAQLAARHLAKVKVAGSNPVIRSGNNAATALVFPAGGIQTPPPWKARLWPQAYLAFLTQPWCSGSMSASQADDAGSIPVGCSEMMQVISSGA